MEIPLHVLFLPSDALISQIFLERVTQRMEELNWNAEQLADLTGLSLLRMADLLKGTSAVSAEERKNISQVLDIEGDQIDSIEPYRVQLLINLLSDWGLSPSQRETVLNYIQQVK